MLFQLGLAAAHAGDPDAAEHLRARRGGRRADAPACPPLDGGPAPGGGRASEAADVLESALADVHEEDDAAKPLIETLIAAGLESATRPPAA